MNIVDSKLKHLIHLCKQTQNYKKMAVVGFVLVSNTIDEISARLGIRARKKQENELLHRYLEFINSVFHNLIKSPIFHTSIIERLKVSELIFLKLRGELPSNYIKEIFELYYDLKQIDIPNIYQVLGKDFIPLDTDLNLFMTMATNKDKKSSKTKQLILHNIHQKEISLQRALQQNFNKESFEQAIYMKQLKNSITKPKRFLSFSGKLSMKEASSLRYIMIGIIIVFSLIGSAILYEMIMFPYLTMAVSIYLILFFGSSLITLLLYLKCFQRGER
ncbi:MAG: hypothetical protein ACFE8E_07120 [Candidatus Hodarchaeota archaeon]